MYPPLRKFTFSPSGSFTTNSLMKVATLWLLTTVHSHFLTPRTSGGRRMPRFSLTLTWQPSLQLESCSLREKNPTSVGRMVPPPLTTWHLHIPQFPFPPQAEGRKILLSARVESRVPPVATSSCFSPLLMSMVTFPDGRSLAFAKSRRATSRRVMIRNTIMETKITVLISNPPRC